MFLTFQHLQLRLLQFLLTGFNYSTILLSPSNCFNQDFSSLLSAKLSLFLVLEMSHFRNVKTFHLFSAWMLIFCLHTAPDPFNNAFQAFWNSSKRPLKDLKLSTSSTQTSAVFWTLTTAYFSPISTTLVSKCSALLGDYCYISWN